MKLQKERITCGNEHTLHGRLHANAIGPALAAYEQIDLIRRRAKRSPLQNIEAGDGRICPPSYRHQSRWPEIEPSKVEPDIVICSVDKCARIVGEVKTCWTMKNMGQEIQRFKNGLTNTIFAHALGQVLMYMEITGSTHSFLSTYQETVVLKLTKDSDSGRSILHMSPIILSRAHVGVDLFEFSVKITIVGHLDRPEYLASSPTSENSPIIIPVTTKQVLLYLMLKINEFPSTEKLPKLPSDIFGLIVISRDSSAAAGTKHKQSDATGAVTKEARRDTGTGNNSSRDRSSASGGRTQIGRSDQILVPASSAWPFKPPGLISSTFKVLVPNQG
ncbi:MAG: hypothetical protein Q9159_004465 [Coniocarpon cinnabarinum]